MRLGLMAGSRLGRGAFGFFEYPDGQGLEFAEQLAELAVVVEPLAVALFLLWVEGPLAVAPLFLHSNRRIHALLGVICLALLIFCLVERHVRLAIAPEDKLDGLWAHRPAKPTGRLIFAALNGLRLHRPMAPTHP